MSHQIISSELFVASSNEQLFTEFTPEEMAMISGGQVRAKKYLENRNFRRGCTYSNENIIQRGRQTYLSFTAVCPINIR